MRRVLIWGAAGLAALLVAAVAALFLIDLSRYKPVLEEQASAALGRPVSIAGKLEIGRSLTPSLSASGVSLANIPGGSREEMARIGRLEVGVELLPLLGGDVSITHFAVVDADFLLEKGADGVGNWVFAPPNAAPEASDSGSRQEEPTEVPFIGRIELRNSTIAHLGADGRTRRLDIDRALLVAASEDDPVDIEIDCVIDGLPVRAVATTGSMGAMSDGTADWPLELALSIGDSRVSVAGTISDPATFAEYQLEIEGDIRTTELIAGILGGPAPQLPAFEIAGVVAGAPDTISLSDLVLKTGGSDVAGALTMSLHGPRPSLIGNLTSNRLALADFSVEASQDPAAAESTPDTDPGGDTAIPLDLLKAADLDLQISVDELALEGLTMTELQGAVELADRQLALSLARANLSDGVVVADLTLNGRAEPAAAAVTANAGQVDVGALLRTLAVSDAVTGRADAALSLDAQGNTVEAMIASANGRATVDMGAGEIDGALAGLVGRSAITALLPIGETDSAPLHCAIGHFDVVDGVATSTAMLVDSEKATIGGEGAIDFGGNQLDLVFSPRSKDPNLLALVAPVRLHGALDAPEVSVLTGDLVLNTATGLLLGAINPLAIVIPFVTAGTGDENQCLAALNDQLEADTDSAPERLVGGAIDAVGGVAEGVGDAASGVGEVLGDVGEGIGDALGGLFGGGE